MLNIQQYNESHLKELQESKFKQQQMTDRLNFQDKYISQIHELINQQNDKFQAMEVRLQALNAPKNLYKVMLSSQKSDNLDDHSSGSKLASLLSFERKDGTPRSEHHEMMKSPSNVLNSPQVNSQQKLF